MDIIHKQKQRLKNVVESTPPAVHSRFLESNDSRENSKSSTPNDRAKARSRFLVDDSVNSTPGRVVFQDQTNSSSPQIIINETDESIQQKSQVSDYSKEIIEESVEEVNSTNNSGK